MNKMSIIIPSSILMKLRDKHSVSQREVEQCFENLCGTYLEDERENHKTDPATLWFIAETNESRTLKVVFIFLDGNIHIKTAYEPSPGAIALYDAKGK
jgi:uncharacterized DUF497 family protein